MGLDMGLTKDIDLNEEVCYWRKYWTLDRWFIANSEKVDNLDYKFLFKTDKLKPILVKMEEYIKKMIDLYNEKYNASIENYDELYSIFVELDPLGYTGDDKLYDLRNLIYTFTIPGDPPFDYDIFDDCVFDEPVLNFMYVYNEFKKAIEYDELYYYSSW